MSFGYNRQSYGTIPSKSVALRSTSGWSPYRPPLDDDYDQRFFFPVGDDGGWEELSMDSNEPIGPHVSASRFHGPSRGHQLALREDVDGCVSSDDDINAEAERHSVRRKARMRLMATIALLIVVMGLTFGALFVRVKSRGFDSIFWVLACVCTHATVGIVLCLGLLARISR